ncbi:hypothetical protein OROMI_031215 [Orobanche minor]
MSTSEGRPPPSTSGLRSPTPLLYRRHSSGANEIRNLASISSSLLPAFGTIVGTDQGALSLKRFVIAPYDRRYRIVRAAVSADVQVGFDHLEIIREIFCGILFFVVTLDAVRFVTHSKKAAGFTICPMSLERALLVGIVVSLARVKN